MKASSPSRNGFDLGGEHFGKFVEELKPTKRASFFGADAIREKCVRAFAKCRLFGEKPENKSCLKRHHENRASAKNLLE